MGRELGPRLPAGHARAPRRTPPTVTPFVYCELVAEPPGGRGTGPAVTTGTAHWGCRRRWERRLQSLPGPHERPPSLTPEARASRPRVVLNLAGQSRS